MTNLAEMIAKNDADWLRKDKRDAIRGYEEIVAARPTDLASLTIQLRWLAREMDRDDNWPSEMEVLQHIVSQLERLAKS